MCTSWILEGKVDEQALLKVNKEDSSGTEENSDYVGQNKGMSRLGGAPLAGVLL